MAITAPENIVAKAIELHEAGQLSKTDICEAIKKEIGYELSRPELVEIILEDKNKKLLISKNKDA